MKNKTTLFMALFLCVSLIFPVVAQDEAQQLFASTQNSNIFRVSGTGFDAYEIVWLRLETDIGVIFNFTETIETDEYGAFSAIVIVPTSLQGSYRLVASTSTVTQEIEYTVPDLTGSQGVQGPKGDPGEPADPFIGYLGVTLGLVSIVLSASSLTIAMKPRSK